MTNELQSNSFTKGEVIEPAETVRDSGDSIIQLLWAPARRPTHLENDPISMNHALL